MSNRQASLLMSVLGLVASFAGCQSSAIRAHALQQEYRATPAAGRFQMQLDGLASAGGLSTAIGPADLLEVRLLTGLPEEPTEPLVLRVSDSGEVRVPHVGQVAVAGLEPDRAAAAITSAAISRGVYRQPSVSVSVTEQATHRITVLGAVVEPGIHDVPRSGCDILSSIAAAGGLSEDAGTNVDLMRHSAIASPAIADKAPPTSTADGIQQVVFQAPPGSGPGPGPERFDLARLSGQPVSRQRLADRDVIIVRSKDERVIHVLGLVHDPGQFDLPDNTDLRVLDAVSMAGGVKSIVADKVLVIRQSPDREEPLVIEVSIADAKRDGRENLVLQAGDLVSAEATFATTALETFTNLFRLTLGVGGNLTLF